MPELTETEVTQDEPRVDDSPEGEPFDRDRAMALIAKLRGEVKASKEQAKELAEVKAALAAREGQDLSERERIEARAVVAEQEREQARAEARALKAERAIERAAVKLGLDPELAGTLMRPESLTDEAVAESAAIEDALKALLAKWPQLGASHPVSNASPTNPKRKAPGLTLEDVKRMSRDEIAANRDAVFAALASSNQ